MRALLRFVLYLYNLHVLCAFSDEAPLLRTSLSIFAVILRRFQERGIVPGMLTVPVRSTRK
jgi:hypothetical protein